MCMYIFHDNVPQVVTAHHHPSFPFIAPVLVSKGPTLKICDFGTARQLNHTTLMTFAGTFAWMAPEVGFVWTPGGGGDSDCI